MKKRIEEMTWDEKAEAALRLAAAKAIEEHRRMGVPIVVWQDNRVQIISAEKIPPLGAEELADLEPW
jgi:hypothetical protein